MNPNTGMPPREVHLIHKKKVRIPSLLLKVILIALLVLIAAAFLMPIVLTIANSFMSSSEISAN